MHDRYESPFVVRYASPEMCALFSEQHRIVLFRKLWTALASAQKKLGLPITDRQLEQMHAHLEKIPFDRVRALEQRTRHDVMAHILAFGEQCPEAKPIIHLGATSTFVTDNADLIQIKEALSLLSKKITILLRRLSEFASAHAEVACLGYTHYQAAQPTTVGKRACLWLQDLLIDALEWERLHQSLPLLGVKGATGTQASFLALFNGNGEKVKELELLVAHEFGFKSIFPICGQTYPRKTDLLLLNTLEAFAAGAHKMATDLRLLSHDGELRERFSEEQVGSSAMPYKRNPMYSERVCALARFLISLAQNPAYTLATQWLERSLDDSANRRLSIPEAFLAADSILNILCSLVPTIHVERPLIKENLERLLPQMIQENILMEAVKRGGNRQEIHEKLRRLKSITPEIIAKDPDFLMNREEAESLCDLKKLVGRAPEQVREFLQGPVASFLERQPSTAVAIPSLEI
jgi:adenylosuccinate lyase